MKLVNKNDYINLFEKTVSGFEKCFNDEGKYIGIGLPYDYQSDKTERLKGFTLPLWGFAAYFAECGGDERWEKLYKNEIKNGTNPFCPDYWGEVAGSEEKVYAMAAVAALLLADSQFVDDFGESEKENLSDWLCSVNNCRFDDIRYILCRLIINIGLKNASMPYSDTAIEDAVQSLNLLYSGNGWYIDRESGTFDFPICASIHFYSLIYAKYIEKAYPERSERIKSRAREFAVSLAAVYDSTGSCAMYGRFTGKRAYALGFWAALLYAGASPFAIGEVKGSINRELRMWAETAMCKHTALRGVKYPNERIASSCKVYDGFDVFAFFLLLALPEDNEFFACEEAEYTQYEAVLAVDKANMIITSSKTNSTVYAGGMTDYFESERYSKFAYSSKFGYCLPLSQRSLEMQAPDSMLCFKINGLIYTNCNAASVEVLSDKRIKTVWSPCDGIEVETVITPYENSHKREHTIRAAFSCEAIDCGYAVDVYNKTASVDTKTMSSEIMTISGGCRIYSEYGEGTVIAAAKNTNTVSPDVKIPALWYNIPIGESKITSVVYEL